MRAGDNALVLSKLSRNTITRAGKLVVPTNVGILFSWLVCQLNGYRVASQVDSSWIRVVAAERGPTFSAAILGLYRNLVLFWHGGSSPYDPVYWTIPFFLKGSMLVYLTLMATTFTRPKFTKWLLIFLYCFAWSGGQALMETNVYAGMFLAELNADYGAQAPSMMPWPISTLMMLSGLFLASFPDENPTWAPWSRALNSLAQYIVPAGGEINRYVVSFGTTLFVFGVFFSREGRQILSHPFMNFLGRISFPIYLLHDIFIRTILSWLVYRQSIFQKGLSPTDQEGKPMWFERGGTLTFAIAIPLFYIILIYIAHLWTIYVDPLCGRLVLWFSKQAFGEDDESALMNKEKLEGILKT
ncbi:hypothetical protein N7478_012809 [Penicillium angulare]|uniref:uncharacterized protein n=1 Tax=Penicillium angulare TaxID=116970 RepID=UPI0025407961|nr:uncharacterized protein N7478_012809 [Penicillium angulare]KAJ5256705.1 hypothetical protein N7478_012809 [Penicillium angulare]